jgi:hypothetical protein
LRPYAGGGLGEPMKSSVQRATRDRSFRLHDGILNVLRGIANGGRRHSDMQLAKRGALHDKQRQWGGSRFDPIDGIRPEIVEAVQIVLDTLGSPVRLGWTASQNGGDPEVQRSFVGRTTKSS